MNTLRACTVLLAISSAVAFAQPNPYRTTDDWPRVGDFRALGSVSSAYPDSRGLIWLAERCGANSCTREDRLDPIIGIDAASGVVVRSFGAGLFTWPHGIYVDADDNIWITDGRAESGRGHQVIKFTRDGEELMRLGEAGMTGSGTNQFSGPTGVVVAEDGSIFVADGHETDSNHRIVKFTGDGEFVMAWGDFGLRPGQFNVPHAIAMDTRGRIFVADRDNNRIQLFEQDGTFIDEWTQFGRPSGMFISADDIIYVSDNQSNDERNSGWTRGIRIGSAVDGSVHAFIPDPAFDPAVSQETSAHGIAADGAGNIYGAEVWSQTIRKYAIVAR